MSPNLSRSSALARNVVNGAKRSARPPPARDRLTAGAAGLKRDQVRSIGSGDRQLHHRPVTARVDTSEPEHVLRSFGRMTG
jgi:hypothetical protein